MPACVDCGDFYELSADETAWFLQKGLSLPKRCAGCRAIRKGIDDEYRTCRRCGKAFLYPREIQLYARTYKWLDPETCLGGCSERKFQQGYLASPLEKKSLLLLGLDLLGKLLNGELRGTAATTKPRVVGLDAIPDFSNSRLQKMLTKLPDAHLRYIREIVYIPTPFLVGTEGHKVVYRGRYNLSNVVSIYDQVPNSPERVETAVGHEIGHAVLVHILSEDLTKKWASLKGAELVPSLSGGNSDEDFCNCYAKYITDPVVLLLVAPEKYYFLYDYVFDQKEFSQ